MDRLWNGTANRTYHQTYILYFRGKDATRSNYFSQRISLEKGVARVGYFIHFNRMYDSVRKSFGRRFPSGSNTITDAANRFDQAPRLAQFGPERGQVDVDRPVGYHGVGPHGVFDELVSRQDPAFRLD